MADIKNRSGISWCILYSKDLTQVEKMVFFALKDRAYQIDKTCMKGFYCYLDWLENNLSLSDKTVQKAIRGLREKQIISSKRVKMHRNVVNQWTINWNIIDDMQKKFKFAEIEYEETDILEDEQPIIQETGEEDKEQLNRREEQTGSKESEILSEETEGGNEEYVVEEYIDKNLNKVLIPFLQKKGAEYYENLNRLTMEVKAVFPDIQLNEISSMIEDMVRIRSKKVG